MKYKSNKLKNLEKNRFSLLTDDLDNCYVCGEPACEINEIFLGRNRQNSMRYGMCIPLCRKCHNEYHRNRNMQVKYMVEGYFKFIDVYSYDEFKSVFKYVKGLDLF